MWHNLLNVSNWLRQTQIIPDKTKRNTEQTWDYLHEGSAQKGYDVVSYRLEQGGELLPETKLNLN